MGLPELKKKLSKKKVAGVLVVAALGLLALFSFAQQNISHMFALLGSVDLEFVVLVLSLQVLFLLFWAKRWGVSLGAMGAKNGVTSLFPIIFGSKFVNNVTLFSYAGGDAVARSYLLRQVEGVSYADGFASSVAEYIPDFVIFTALTVSSLFLSFGKFSVFQVILISTFGLGFLSAIIFILHSVTKGDREPGRIEDIVSWVSQKIGRPKSESSIQKKISLFGSSFRQVFSDTETVIKISFLSVLIWGANVAILFGLFLGFGVVPPLPSIFLAMTLPMIVGMIPITVAGLGTMDATRAGILLLFMPHQGLVIANVILLRRLVGFVFTTIVGGGTLSLLGFRIWRD